MMLKNIFVSPQKNISFFFAFILFLASFFASIIIPPLSSPDEWAHVERAYLFSQGQIVLHTPANNLSGGMVDTGLLIYLNSFSKYPFHTDKKISEKDYDIIKKISWSGKKVFSVSAGTGFYFPVIYFPQATGLTIGRWLNFSVDKSYKISRFFTQFSIFLIIFSSFYLFTPNLTVISLLILPMSIFQASASSLDGMSTAITILVLSCFFRIFQKKKNASLTLIIFLNISITLLITSRLHAFPLLSLVFAVYLLTKKQICLWMGCITSFIGLGWTLTAIQTTVTHIPMSNPSTIDKVAHYLSHPVYLFGILYNTISNHNLEVFYTTSFLGNLGWLDTPLSNTTYCLLGFFLLFFFIFSISLEKNKELNLISFFLFSLGFLSVFLIFFALLLTWTQPDALLIDGVQGRYFLIPALIFSYALGEKPLFQNNMPIFYFCTIILASMYFFSNYEMISALLHRYYIA
ncbi:DUF2142 domain-containing protein [Acetobacter indonesiensis]|uniref:DUF2142 domain-containing protein n=1 Tax=Acetobacter indonesiensis TaxID=104101 RepID=UPI001F1582EA|nr:DUF2142 domain-containing protein [Acetobacter indonesiensis]MCG0994827.1 DUF2142 domain-containing protein [Acetobacter indonesiensis]